MSERLESADLWLHMESDGFSVSCSRRFRGSIRLFPADRLIAIDQSLLRWGVFAGAARACPLRLESLPTHFPQFAIRLDSQFRWRLMGFDGPVFHNRYELADRTVVLEVGDTITCEPYRLRVVAAPDPDQLLQEFVEQVLPANMDAAKLAESETDFQLNLQQG